MAYTRDQTPPRNGEGDRDAQRRGGGVLVASADARQLARKERRSGNLPEVLVWRELRKRPGGYRFRRQHPISEMVLDFACLERRLAIEIDGEAHSRGDRPTRDVARDRYLNARGFEVLRLPAQYVLENLDDAITSIVAACDARLLLHHPAVAGRPPSQRQARGGL